jgi:Pyridoxamine 5'-phosphate oxidase
MGSVHPAITPPVAAWIREQHMFFVATAPLDGDGHVNLSPKGLDTVRVLDDRTVAYLDLTGSGVETVAHVRENGRITLMWCAFAGPPKILRIHGHGEPVFRDDSRWADLIARFPADAATAPGVRSIMLISAVRISDSCGYAVPLMDYQQDRTLHADFFGRKSDEEFAAYCETKEHNAASIDNLPAVPLPLPPRPA